MPLTFAQVDTFAMSLPGVTVGARWQTRTWLVGDKGFIWERPLRKADIARLGDARIPSGDILGVRTENLDAKDALLAMDLPGFFTIEHFRNYPAILIELRKARATDVRAAIEAAYNAVARSRRTKRAETAATKRPRTQRRASARGASRRN